jgi:hypothetical protein
LTSLDFVTVGNPGNANDTHGDGYGAVDYAYAIGKYEVTAGQYTAFLNGVAATDTYGLYNTNMWSSGYGCKIERSGTSGSYTYSVAADRANRPVNYVSFWDAARFVNWLHNDQGNGDTESGAYVNVGKQSTFTRSADAKYWIPTENEWYKAAYYDPNKSGGAGYWDYPTSNDSEPSNVLTDPDPGNNANFNANFPSDGYTIGESDWRMTEVGEFENSTAPTGRSTRVETSGNGTRRPYIRLVVCGAALGSSIPAACWPPPATSAPRRTRASASVSVWQVFLSPLASP